MSTFNIKSRVIAARDGVPPLLTDPINSKGDLKAVVGVGETGDAIMDAGSTMRLISMPSNGRLQSLEYSKVTTGTTTLDIAAWYPASIPQGGENAPAAALEGTLISSSFFLIGIAGVDGTVGWTTAFGATTTPSLQVYTQPIWQILGLANDPGIDIDLGVSVRVATAEQGYVGMRATYVD